MNGNDGSRGQSSVSYVAFLTKTRRPLIAPLKTATCYVGLGHLQMVILIVQTLTVKRYGQLKSHHRTVPLMDKMEAVSW